ncbi:hypothetical protein EYF80_062145 [Liparis tanakae]|uniref:Uncharacterized protein n=1 Tax=Liparis tanakae TaxID=230148 RepID=A0A4Z2EFP0_9TELE|nr:hypothetical protein EYF80_062145 [Liparis tanakae]
MAPTAWPSQLEDTLPQCGATLLEHPAPQMRASAARMKAAADVLMFQLLLERSSPL